MTMYQAIVVGGCYNYKVNNETVIFGSDCQHGVACLTYNKLNNFQYKTILSSQSSAHYCSERPVYVLITYVQPRATRCISRMDRLSYQLIVASFASSSLTSLSLGSPGVIAAASFSKGLNDQFPVPSNSSTWV